MTKWTPSDLDALNTVDGFRLRSENMTRLEVFSDAAFAFAMTMLVVSVGKIPENHAELMVALKGIPALLLSFSLIALFWSEHRSWSQRYGLETTTATFLTLGLIFVVLVFVYPLRLIVSSFCSYFTLGWLPSEFAVESFSELASLFVVYGFGYAAISTLFVLLHVTALRASKELGLNAIEMVTAKQSRAIWLTQLGFGLLSAAFAIAMPPSVGVYAGFVYVGLGAALWWVINHYERRLKALRANLD
ncbi:MAG: TMEM175 family protein [Gammaproteobacteria bacterium]